MIDLNVYEFNKKEDFLFFASLLAMGIGLSLLFYRNILFTIVIIPFAGKIKKMVIDEIIARRKRDYLVQLKDYLFVASTAIGAGRSMKDAISEAIPELVDIYGERSILANELRKAYRRMQVGGENDVDVLMDWAICSRMEDCVDFVTIYSICKTTGASLVIAMNKAASVIIDKMTIEREIKELVRRKEREGLIIFVMPVIVILFLNLSAPDYIAPLYESIGGRIIMTVVIAANVGIYGMIKKIVDVKI